MQQLEKDQIEAYLQALIIGRGGSIPQHGRSKRRGAGLGLALGIAVLGSLALSAPITVPWIKERIQLSGGVEVITEKIDDFKKQLENPISDVNILSRILIGLLPIPSRRVT